MTQLELLNELRNLRDTLQIKLLKSLTALTNSSPEGRGPLINVIDQTETDLNIVNSKIDEYETKLKILSVFKIIVITGTKTRVRANLGDELYNLLIPPGHDDEKCRYWRPFAQPNNIQNDKIVEILDKLKRKGYDIIEHYVEGTQDDALIAQINKNPLNNIAIIDLLSLDMENGQVARRINTDNIGGVIIPVNSHLDNRLKDYMSDRRAQIFDRLETHVDSTVCSFYDHATADIQYLIQGLEKVMKKVSPATTSTGAANAENIRYLRPGF